MDKYIHTEKDLSSKEISSINRLIQYCEDPQKISSVFSVLDISQIMGRIYFYKNHQGARKALIHACSLTIAKDRPGKEKSKNIRKVFCLKHLMTQKRVRQMSILIFMVYS